MFMIRQQIPALQLAEEEKHIRTESPAKFKQTELKGDQGRIQLPIL